MPLLRLPECYKMPIHRFISIKLSFCLAIGILIASFLNTPPVIALICTLSTLLILIYSFKKTKIKASFGFLAALTTMGIGMTSFSISQPKYHHDHYIRQYTPQKSTWQLKIKEVLKASDFSQRYLVDIQKINEQSKKGTLLLSIAVDSTKPTLLVDDELIMCASATAVTPPLNPHQFNYKQYLESIGVYHQIHLKTANYSILPSSISTFNGKAATLRNYIVLKLKEANFGDDELGIIQALLLGERTAISNSVSDDYKKAGAIHILAVSGLHIGILLLVLQTLLRPIPNTRKNNVLKLFIIVIVLWGFAFLAGLSPSVVRAVAMFSFVAYALYLNRPTSTFNILALSFFFTLLVYPMSLFQVGFQMSYAAVFSILWIYPLLQKYWAPNTLILKKTWQLLSVSIAAQLGVLPISLFYFHQFPALFFVSNLIIIPILGLVLSMGILVIILAVSNSLPALVASIYNSMIGAMNWMVNWIAQQETFVFSTISWDVPQLILSYIILIASIRFFTKPNFKKMIPIFLSIIGFLGWVLWVGYDTQRKQVVFVAHQTKKTVLAHQKGHHLSIYSNDTIPDAGFLQDYKIGERIHTTEKHLLKNAYTINSKSLFILDSLCIIPDKLAQPNIVLLTQSPRIHLERFIDSVQPNAIVADGSNYHSFVQRWKATCLKRKIPFHYTGEKGIYYFK